MHSAHSCARSSPDRRGAMDLSHIDKLRDPIWRISNLYSIRTRFCDKKMLKCDA